MKTSHKTWDKQEILQLIKRYQQYEILWNTKMPQYKNRALKHESLRELSIEFRTPVSEIQRKVHNLRCQLNSELKKLKKKKTAGEASLKSSWEYFEPLLFILSANSRLDGDLDAIDISDHLKTMIESNDTISIKQEVEDVDYLNSVNRYGSTVKKIETDQHDPQIEGDVSQNTLNDCTAGCSRLKEVSFEAEVNRVMSERNQTTKGKVRPNKKMKLDFTDRLRDDCQIFGDFVAAELRNLKSDDNRRKLKRAIQKAILEVSDSDG